MLAPLRGHRFVPPPAWRAAQLCISFAMNLSGPGIAVALHDADASASTRQPSATCLLIFWTSVGIRSRTLRFIRCQCPAAGSIQCA